MELVIGQDLEDVTESAVGHGQAVFQDLTFHLTMTKNMESLISLQNSVYQFCPCFFMFILFRESILNPASLEFHLDDKKTHTQKNLF